MKWTYDRVYSCYGGARPGLVGLVDALKPLADWSLWPGYGYNCRTIRGSRRYLSQHAGGKAYDFKASYSDPHQREVAEELVEFLTSNWPDLGVQEVIWNRRRWGGSRGPIWRPYKGVSPHTDHVHFSITNEAADRVDLGDIARELLNSKRRKAAMVNTVIVPGKWGGVGKFPRYVVFKDGRVIELDGAPSVQDLVDMGVVPDADIVDAQYDHIGGWLVLIGEDGGTFALKVE